MIDDFDARFDRDCEREPSYTDRPRTAQLDARGSVKIHYVCPPDLHEQMKTDGRFDAMPIAGRGYMLVERDGDLPAEVIVCRNCSCSSTLAKVIDTDSSPTWLDTLRMAGLL